MGKLVQGNNLGGACQAPRIPDASITYSCIYEFFAVLDCSCGTCNQECTMTILGRNGIPTRTYTAWNPANGTILTRTAAGSINVPRSLGVYRQGPYQAHCRPFSAPVLIGQVHPDEWAKIKGVGVPQDGTILHRWQAAPAHNQLKYPHRYLLMKYYMEVLHNAPRPDPAASPPVLPFACPAAPDTGHANYPPMPLTAEWTASGQSCPNYYKLTACTDCSGFNLNDASSSCKPIKDKIWEMPPGHTLNQPIIKYPLRRYTTTGTSCFTRADVHGQYHCHQWQLLGLGPRTSHSDFMDIDVVDAGTKLVIDDQNSVADFTALYQELADCQDCYQDYLIAISYTTGDPKCDSWTVNAPMGGADTFMASRCVNAGHLSIFRMGQNLTTSMFLIRNGKDFWYQAGGVCYHWTTIDSANHGGCMPAFLKNLSYWLYNSNLRRAVQSTRPNYIHTLPNKVYTSACKCYEDGGRVSQAIENVCDPPVLPPRITLDLPARRTENQARVIDLEINAAQVDPARLGVPVKYQWYRNGKAMGGETGRTLHFAGLNLTSHPGRYFCRATNLGNKGQLQWTQSQTVLLTVVDIAVKLYGNRKTVYKICVNTAFSGVIPTRTGRFIPPLRFTARKCYWTLNDFTGKVGRFHYVGDPTTGNGKYYKVASAVQTTWGALTPAERGIKPPNNDETNDNSLTRSGASEVPGAWETTAYKAFTRS